MVVKFFCEKGLGREGYLSSPPCLREALSKTCRVAPYGKSLQHTSLNEAVVVIPTYNERENIGRLIEAIRDLQEPFDILVVDDNSPDGTADVVEEYINSTEGVYLLRRPGKQGLGNAYKAGFAFALRHGWDYICQMDADFSHHPQDLPRLLSACRNGADVALGSRYMKGGRIEGWPLSRWLLSRTANFVAQVLLGNRISDLTGGFKCFHRKALQCVNLESVAGGGYVFQVEMNDKACSAGLGVHQVPICFTERRQGQSKMGFHEASGGISRLLALRMARRRQFTARRWRILLLRCQRFLTGLIASLDVQTIAYRKHSQFDKIK